MIQIDKSLSKISLCLPSTIQIQIPESSESRIRFRLVFVVEFLGKGLLEVAFLEYQMGNRKRYPIASLFTVMFQRLQAYRCQVSFSSMCFAQCRELANCSTYGYVRGDRHNNRCQSTSSLICSAPYQDSEERPRGSYKQGMYRRVQSLSSVLRKDDG